MREILFRGKTEQGKWLYGYLVKGNYNTGFGIIEDHIDMGLQYVKEETVGQFIGLTDKNGKKIFEGDIVKFFWFDTDNITTIGDIRYSETGCTFLWYEQGEFPCGFDNTTKMEVIGNIHDNPEFLEKFK